MDTRPFALCLSAALGSALVLCACGSREHDEIPPELLVAIAQGRTPSADYPAGPYGSEIGDVAQNVCLQGWRNPAASAYAESEMTTLCFSDFWDPEAEQHSLLLVNTSAVWCGACRSEFGGSASRPSLEQEIDARAERGLVALGALFQDAEFQPATAAHARLWAQTFEVGFPFGVDGPFAMGAFADPMLQPYNLLLDTRTMRIVLQVQGDEPETLWPAIDQRLGE